MTRDEALRILGLEEDATEADIKAAYKEMAQILHPDRFQDNRRLADRATEQFKQVNEARDYLLSGRGFRRSSGRGPSGTPGTSARHRAASGRGPSGYSDRATALRARLAGIAAARVQLVAQLDADRDSRKVGFMLLVGGLLAGLLGRFLRPLLALAPVAFVWGIIQVFTSQARIGVIRKHLETLDAERLRTEQELEKL
ncbi:MAG: DnaJ domain-containing protein [Coriobacteriales bacterium]|jgi:curved DNA-binding protein CbpA|nr:DnaJ domain-containing protein [Coriobacteriales bacterium]